MWWGKRQWDFLDGEFSIGVSRLVRIVDNVGGGELTVDTRTGKDLAGFAGRTGAIAFDLSLMSMSWFQL